MDDKSNFRIGSKSLTALQKDGVMDQPQFSMVTTADGSVSCMDAETGELLHNRIGAYTEALKNYVEPSELIELAKKTGEVRVLDACYGMGYNTWVLAQELLRNLERPFTLKVIAIERNPEILSFLPHVLENPTFDLLNFKTGPSEHNTYYRTHGCFSDTKGVAEKHPNIVISVANGCRITIEFLIGDLREMARTIDYGFDAVFHDPFSPQKMPELWTVDLFRIYHELLSPRQGCLLTYSAAAAVRGGLIEAGFQIQKTVPLGQKNGGTYASTGDIPESPFLMALTEPELSYIQSRAGIPYRDTDLRSTRETILERRKLEQSESLRPSGNSGRKLLRL